LSKLIVTTLLLVGLVGMIGTAASDSMIVNDSAIYDMVPGGPAIKVHIDITEITFTGVHTMTATVYGIGSSDSSNVELYIVHPSIPDNSLTQSGSVTFSWTPDDFPDDILELWIKSKAGTPVGEKYNIIIEDTATLPITITAATNQVTSIHEFPTIALPVATLLGFMFFINSRKKEK
jgi:hypothetical protein